MILITHVVALYFRLVLVVLPYVLDGISWSDDLGRSLLSFWRPEGEACQESSMRDLELEESIRDVTSCRCQYAVAAIVVLKMQMRKRVGKF